MSDELKPRESVDTPMFLELLYSWQDATEELDDDTAYRAARAALIVHIDAWGARLAGDAVRDAERYRWLKAASPQLLCAAAWKIPAAAQHSDVDAAVDAARIAAPTPKEPPCGS